MNLTHSYQESQSHEHQDAVIPSRQVWLQKHSSLRPWCISLCFQQYQVHRMKCHCIGCRPRFGQGLVELLCILAGYHVCIHILLHFGNVPGKAGSLPHAGFSHISASTQACAEQASATTSIRSATVTMRMVVIIVVSNCSDAKHHGTASHILLTSWP